MFKTIELAKLRAEAEGVSLADRSFADDLRIGSTQDVLRFLRAWMSNPLGIGSILPSSRALAELMTSEISPDTGKVIELGPGTGVFTQALLERGVHERELTLVESGSHFTGVLAQRFPRARILRMDAAHLHRAGLFPQASVGAVVSGLPLLSMSPHQIRAILAGAFECLCGHGAFYQFTYGFRCPVPQHILGQLGLKAVRMGRIVANMPPAAAYRITAAIR